VDRVIEPFVRIDRSSIWRLHDSWWADHGVDAFDLGGVPSLATSNGVAASDRARFYLALVGHLVRTGLLTADEQVSVLELGAGDGRFAANFLRALDEHGPDGRALLARTRYLLTDASQPILDEAAAGPRLAHHVTSGRIVPRLLDVTAGTSELADEAPITLVLANYVASILPAVHLQRRADGTCHALMTRVRAHASVATTLDDVVVDAVWAPADFATCFDDRAHRDVVRLLTDALPESTLAYPERFLAALRRLAPRLAPGGVFVVTDCGRADARAIRGAFTLDLNRYGGSLAEGVYFPVFDAFAAVFGWGAERTDEPLDPLHTAILAPEGLDAPTRAAFASHLGERRAMELMDTRAAGAYALDDGEHRLALRYYLRCVELDPHEAEHHYRVGLAAIADEDFPFAIHHLLVAHDEDLERRWDVAFELGRAHALAGDPEAAIAWYRESLVQAPHAVTWANLADLLAAVGRDDEAREAARYAAASDAPTAI